MGENKMEKVERKKLEEKRKECADKLMELYELLEDEKRISKRDLIIREFYKICGYIEAITDILNGKFKVGDDDGKKGK